MKPAELWLLAADAIVLGGVVVGLGLTAVNIYHLVRRDEPALRSFTRQVTALVFILVALGVAEVYRLMGGAAS